VERLGGADRRTAGPRPPLKAALTLSGVYVPFTDIGAAVLKMFAATRGITVNAADGAELTDRFATPWRSPGGNWSMGA